MKQITLLGSAIVIATSLSATDGKYERNMKKAETSAERDAYYKAIGHYEKALALRPKSKIAMLQMARCYDQLGESSQAINWYEKAIAAGPVEESDRRRLTFLQTAE